MHELTHQMQYAIETIVQQYPRELLISSGKMVSERYRTKTGTQRRLSSKQDAAAYAASRMPATYGAAHVALTQCVNATGISNVSTFLDCGFGTGSVSLAANEIFKPNQIYVQEYEMEMATIGQHILELCGKKTKLILGNVCEVILPEAELVTEGYLLSELSEVQRKKAVRNMWGATERVLVLIEPGTPEGFSLIQEAKKLLIENGANIIAPCATDKCPVTGKEWCHFSARVSRSQLHKQIKRGEAGFEDEKFIYMAFSRGISDQMVAARVIRHPIIEPGKITMTLCTRDGMQERIFTKKDPLWRKARKKTWGECFLECP